MSHDPHSPPPASNAHLADPLAPPPAASPVDDHPPELLPSQRTPPPACVHSDQPPPAVIHQPAPEPPVVDAAAQDTPAVLLVDYDPPVLPPAELADDFPGDPDKCFPIDRDQTSGVQPQGPTDEEQAAEPPMPAVNAEEDICVSDEHQATGVQDQEPPVDGDEGQAAEATPVVSVEEDIVGSESLLCEPAKQSSLEETPVEIASGENQEQAAHADVPAMNGDREAVIESHESFVIAGEATSVIKTSERTVLHSQENGAPLENGLEPGQDVYQKSEKAQEAEDEEELPGKRYKDGDRSAGIGVSGLKSPLIFTGVVLAVLGVAVACLKKTH